MDRFETFAEQAYGELPEWVREAAHNVAVTIEDDPPEPGLLGLYEGVPLTESFDDAPLLPAVITLYRRSICAAARSEAAVAAEVRVTLFHEIAHHLGIDDDRLDELGWA